MVLVTPPYLEVRPLLKEAEERHPADVQMPLDAIAPVHPFPFLVLAVLLVLWKFLRGLWRKHKLQLLRKF